MNWLQILFYTTPEHQESLEDALLSAGACSITYQDAADQPILEPALNETPLWNDLVITALFDAGIQTTETLNLIKTEFGFELPRHKIEILEDKDWVREWMKDYQPMQFGKRLWICPSWCDTPNPDAVNLLLDPGLAFGTGTHPTTAMCLHELDKMDLQDKTVLDYGCGSGILAIAALLLGAKSAVAVDIDPQALLATRANAKRNHITNDILHLYLAGDEPDLKADIVIANILAGPLVELAPQLSAMTATNGEIILSGLLNEQQQAVTAHYNMFNFSAASMNEWLCLHGKKK